MPNNTLTLYPTLFIRFTLNKLVFISCISFTHHGVYQCLVYI